MSNNDGIKTIHDYLKILNLNNDDLMDSKKIKYAFHKLLKIHHPDKGGDEEKCKEIIEAYIFVSNHNENKKNQNENDDQGEENILNLKYIFANLKKKDFYNLLSHLYTRVKEFVNEGYDERDEKEIPINKNHIKPEKPEKIILDISLSDLYYSQLKSIRIQKSIICDNCRTIDQNDQNCNKCNNKKFILLNTEIKFKCESKINSNHSPILLFHPQQQIHNPPLIIFDLNHIPDLRFQRYYLMTQDIAKNEYDLYTELNISLIESLGNLNKLFNIFNTTIYILYNDVIRDNMILIAPNFGLPMMSSNGDRGNLYIKFNIIYPQIFTQAMKKKLISELDKNLNGNRNIDNNISHVNLIKSI